MVVAELLDLSQQLLDSIADGDWETYERLCDPTLSAFEPEARGYLVEGLAFHKFYFDQQAYPSPSQTTMIAPHVRMLGNDVAVISYIRLIQYLAGDGAPQTARNAGEAAARATFQQSLPNDIVQQITYKEDQMRAGQRVNNIVRAGGIIPANLTPPPGALAPPTGILQGSGATTSVRPVPPIGSGVPGAVAAVHSPDRRGGLPRLLPRPGPPAPGGRAASGGARQADPRRPPRESRGP